MNYFVTWVFIFNKRQNQLFFFIQNKYVAREIADNNIPIVRTTVCAALVDSTRIVCGTEEGLYSYHLSKESVTRIDENKKVMQLEMVHEEQLLIVLSGNFSLNSFFFQISTSLE